MTSSTTDRRLGLTGGRAIKTPCRAATTSNITLSGEQTVDGVSCVTGDRVLVKSQTSSADNGIYVVDTGTWTRDLDFDGPNDVTTGTIVMVLNGSANVNTYWRLTTTGTVTFGSSAITFASAMGSDAALLAFLQSGTGAVSRTAQDKMRERVSAKDFGAVGDGTDATAAIFAAVASLPASGGVVYLPAGSYKITSSITLARHQGLVGDGVSTATVTNGATTIIKTGNFDGIVLSNFECVLRDFTIRGDSGNGGDGIYARFGHADFRNVASNDHGGVGWRFGDKTAASANTNHCTGSGIKAIGNTSHGIYFNDANAAANANNILLESIDARSNGGDGIRIENAYDNTLLLPSAQTNTGYGLHFMSGAKGNVALTPYTETNTAGTIILDSGSVENFVLGARQGTADGYTDNGTRNTIVGRDFSKQGDLIWKKLWAVQATISNASFVGNITFSQTGADKFALTTSGNTTSDIEFLNASGTVRLKVNGRNGYYKGAYTAGATVNHGTVGANSTATATVTVTGARDGMSVIATARQAAGIVAGLAFGGAWISADDTVSIRLINPTAGGIASNVAWRITVIDILDS